VTAPPVPVPPELRRLRAVSTAFLGVLLTGIFGYQYISGMTFSEALYMTVITVTTVGFAEVVPLDTAGRMLTVFLIAGGVASVSYAAVTAAEFVVEGHLGHYIESRRMQRSIESMSDHIIICGYGRVGRHLATALQVEGVDFVMVENQSHKLEELTEAGILLVDGDATHELVLEAAGLSRASALVACVNTDADNVLITLTAKWLRPEAQIIARAKADENESKLRRAGADRVILPSSIGGRRIASLLTRPVVSDFLEGLGVGGSDLTLEEVPIMPGGDLDGETLRDANLRERWGITVLAVRHDDLRMDTHPSAELTLRGGDVLVVMGGDEEVAAMRENYI
jgi:voltage-gated potassium channel